jgi:hypothetical protein
MSSSKWLRWPGLKYNAGLAPVPSPTGVGGSTGGRPLLSGDAQVDAEVAHYLDVFADMGARVSTAPQRKGISYAQFAAQRLRRICADYRLRVTKAPVTG